MALETVIFPQDPFSYTFNRDYLYSLATSEEEKLLLGIINNNNNNNIEQQSVHANWDSSSTSVLQNVKEQWDSHSSPEVCTGDQSVTPRPPPCSSGRRKRRRTKSAKNKEEIENQRMTHIAVERNRRKQMNEYLAVLRSLMPPSYVQRGDQASIIGGAINFVKELEQLLQSMEGQKKSNNNNPRENNKNNGLNGSSSSPFSEFFTFPQYTTTRATTTMAQKEWAVADIEVTMVDSHANMKILSKKKPGLLMKVVIGLQSLRLSILHLNVTTLDDSVLYSVSVKVEEGCELNTVDEIAGALNQLLRVAQQQLPFN